MFHGKHVAKKQSGGTRLHATSGQRREANTSWEAVRLFQELAQSLATSNRGADHESDAEPSRDRTWWQSLADISGMAPASVKDVNGEGPIFGASLFCFNPSPGELKELSRTVHMLSDKGPELGQIDQIVLTMLREVECRLARSGLQGAYTAALSAEDDQASA